MSQEVQIQFVQTRLGTKAVASIYIPGQEDFVLANVHFHYHFFLLA